MNDELALANYAPLLVAQEFAEREGVQFDATNFGGDISYKNQYVLILTGRAAQALFLAHDRAKQRALQSN